MTHSSSGKRGYTLYNEYTEYNIDEDKLVEILKKENQLRFSKEIQLQYSQDLQGNEYLEHIKNITERVQERALLECGIPESEIVEALKVLRSHRWRYRDRPDILRLSVYGRFDKCWEGRTFAGDPVSNCDLYDLDGKRKILFDMMTQKPLLIIASSLS